MRHPSTKGFTLLESMIALLILAGSLAVLMQAQASSLAKAGKARDMSIAALLARGKMIDIEREIFDEGFTQGEQTDKGDFDEEGYPEFKWSSRINEVELDIGLLEDLCSGFSGEEGGAEDCSGMIGGLGGLIDPLTQNIANSVRLVQLDISWPEGKYKNGFSIRTLLTQEGFGFASNPPDLSGLPGATPPGGAPAADGSVQPPGLDQAR